MQLAKQKGGVSIVIFFVSRQHSSIGIDGETPTNPYVKSSDSLPWRQKK